MKKNRIKISPDLSLHLKIKTYWKGLTSEVVNALKAYPTDVIFYSHAIRVQIKRIRSLLLLIKDQLQAEEYEEFDALYQELGNRLGLIREHYILLKTFQRIRTAFHSANSQPLVDFYKTLELQYDDLLKEINLDRNSFLQYVDKFNASTLKIDNVFQSIDNKKLKKRYQLTCDKCFKIAKSLSLGSSAEDFHSFRKWAKKVLYQQIFFKQILKQRCKVRHNSKLKKIAKIVGEEHDLQILRHQWEILEIPLNNNMSLILNHRIVSQRKRILQMIKKVF
ncbi:MAG: CHAD domain-containing protein [Bacteroidota bacterium]|nr:CHAD domain-containing protein [Bacteroidota bacterium]